MPHHEGVGYQSTDTSREAAMHIAPTVSTVQKMVIDALAEGMLTSEEAAIRTGCDYRTIQPRFSELQDRGWVRDSGVRRKSSRGRNIIAWEITALGRKAHAYYNRQPGIDK